ncbi:helix-turn-helix domain-containing protein [Streptomyces olivochromogenes]|uniref:helix-turn-helix domain-containing protein n=1 Tax=Streptomyces olivochromogenes TaxID=1963 RepID=UPI001F423C8D|nr:helix-turn-helix domain-containing protein [Streptomyces olivochromogenes]MCF3134758.1 helix-turn-helix domain-containing protein [Streptomyces olivochromogenes]
MLRIHFTDADLARTRVAAAPDPLWEITFSLHRFQTRQGRWAYADWHRRALAALSEKGLGRALPTRLLPLFPRAAYFPDFLNPAEASLGLAAGLAAIVDTPPDRVRNEVGRLAVQPTGAPSWLTGLTEKENREELAAALKDYYNAAIAPYDDQIRARLDSDRHIRCRTLLHGGVERLLGSFGTMMRWRAPVLHVDYPVQDRDLHLGGRGLLLVPSYFCWRIPVALSDPELPQVLVYPLHPVSAPEAVGNRSERPLAVLLGRTRANVLRSTATGATTGELARAAGISASAASQHTTALRDAGLISTRRNAASVLHTLTPLGASLLRMGRPGGP